MRSSFRFSFLLLVAGALSAAPSPVNYSRLPLVFEPNVGQLGGPTAEGASFVARARGHQLLFTGAGVRVQLAAAGVELSLAGANAATEPAVEQRLQSVSNYYLGSFHKAGVPHFGRVRYRSIYPGIDWVFYGKEGEIEFDFEVAGGVDAGRIRLLLSGAAPSLDAQGNLTLGTGVKLKRPVAYQEVAGRRVFVDAGYRIGEDRSVTFQLGAYDAARPLVIDPVLTYSTYLGGTGIDIPNGFAVDANGNAYLTGETESANFPTASAAQGAKAAASDAFVTKLNAQGGYVYSTFLGGDQADRGNGIAVDGSGNAYVAGATDSSNFPLQGPYSSSGRLFVTKLSSTGAISYSTRIPAAGLSEARKIAVDGSNQAVVTGLVFGGLPVQSAQQSTLAGSSDAFVTKLNAAGNGLVFSTYLGGAGTDVGSGIASDSVGNTWVTGSTTSSAFPTASPTQASLKGLADGFVSRYSPTGGLLFSTYLGTNSGAGESGLGAAVDSSGRGCAAGSTSAIDFPAVNATFPAGTLAEGWVVCFNTDHTIRFSLPLQFRAAAIAISATGRIAAGGEAPAAFQIPVLNPVQAVSADFFRDAFFTVLESSGVVANASYLGGVDEDFAVGVGFDAGGALYVAGQTSSPNFLRTANAVQTAPGGLSDAFVARIDLGAAACVYTASPAFVTVQAGGGSSNMAVSTGATCPWNLRVTNPFFTVPSPNAINSGSGAVSITVPANTGLTPRLGGIQLPSGEGTTVYQHGTGGACGVNATAIGQTQQGTLTTSSCRSPFRIGLRPTPPSYVQGVPAYGQLYSFSGTAGQKIAIEMSSAAFDPYLFLFSPGGTQLGENDDQTASQKTGSTTSRIPSTGYFTLPATGTYYVDATTFLENATGAFSLRIDQEALVGPPLGAVRFVPVVPCRVADTRLATGPFGGPVMAAGQTREFAVPSSGCGIPTTARAYSMNVTVVPAGPLSYLTLWPSGSVQPFVSTLNSFDGRVVANAAILIACIIIYA